jgi:hypothetical protein
MVRTSGGDKRSILKKDGPLKKLRPHVNWRTHLVGEDALTHDGDADPRAASSYAMRKRLLSHVQTLRLPMLTYEMIFLPMRVAHDRMLIERTKYLIADLMVDAFAILTIVRAEQARGSRSC